jgi:putative ABC transport system permease protein
LAGIRGLSRPLLISLRNTFRQKGRLALTLFTLTLGGSIFIAVFNVQEALNVKIEQSLKYFLADVNLDLDRDYRVEQIASLVGSIPGVERVEGWQIGSAEILNDDKSVAGNITLFAPPIESDLVEPELLGGRWLQPGDSNAITVNEAYWKDYPDLTPGSTIRLKISGREQDWQVVGIFQYTGAEDYYAFTDYDSLAGATKTVGRSSTYRVVTTSHDPALQREIAVEIDNLLQARGIKVSKVEAGSTTVQTVTDYIGILTAVLLVMAILTALVGSIGLAGTLGMNVMERTREIGVMRAIGAFNQIIMRLVIVEGLVIGMLSYALSMVLCLPISSLLSNVVSLAIFNAPAQLALTYKGFVIWLLLVVALSVVASMVPARNASRMTIREVLAYE